MKWFKHYSNASSDAALCALINKFGAAGYGHFWMLVEICALKYEGDQRVTFDLDQGYLALTMRSRRSKCRVILELCEGHHLFTFREVEDRFIIEWPKLLKFVHRDAIARKKNPEKLQTETSPIRIEETHQRRSKRSNKDQSGDRSKFNRSDFEKIYNQYPRKIGKAKGLERCATQIKTETDYLALEKAIARYRAHCVAQNTEEKFIKHFSSFMNSWRDWIDSDAGSSDIKHKTFHEKIMEAISDKR